MTARVYDFGTYRTLAHIRAELARLESAAFAPGADVAAIRLELVALRARLAQVTVAS